MERSSLQLQGFEPGQPLRVQTADGKEHALTVIGLSHEVGAAPAFYAGRVAGHVTPDTLADLGYDTTFDELHVKVADPTLDQDGIRSVVDDVSTRIQRAGIPVFGSYVPVPGRHPANDLLQGFFLVLGFIGALSLVVSGFLVINTVSAILAQQTRQIGIMKAIGARNGQIAGLYLVLVFAYAVLALMVALPLSALGAYAFAQFTAGLANFDIGNLSIPPGVIALEIVIGLVVPCWPRSSRSPAGSGSPSARRWPPPASRTGSGTGGSTGCCARSAGSRARRSSRSATRSAARAG